MRRSLRTAIATRTGRRRPTPCTPSRCRLGSLTHGTPCPTRQGKGTAGHGCVTKWKARARHISCACAATLPGVAPRRVEYLPCGMAGRQAGQAVLFDSVRRRRAQAHHSLGIDRLIGAASKEAVAGTQKLAQVSLAEMPDGASHWTTRNTHIPACDAVSQCNVAARCNVLQRVVFCSSQTLSRRTARRMAWSCAHAWPRKPTRCSGSRRPSPPGTPR